MISPGNSPRRSSPTCEHPLTAHSMQEEYNRDTWRMYQRIQAARLQSEQIIACVEEAVEETSALDLLEDVDTHTHAAVAQLDDFEEGVFEIDL